jgi:hypothetical protein
MSLLIKPSHIFEVVSVDYPFSIPVGVDFRVSSVVEEFFIVADEDFACGLQAFGG